MAGVVDGWSAQRLVDAGANAVKLLLYYSSRSSATVNDIKHTFVEKVAAECADAEVLFFFELVSLADGMNEKGPDFARMKREIVSGGITEFSKQKYRVDVLKVGLPVNLSLVAGSPAADGEPLHSRQEAMNLCLQAASCAGIPFIYLSEGVSIATFQFGLELASEATIDFSGVLYGRATWKDGVEVFVKKGGTALQDWLADEGVRNIESVNRCLVSATPWFNFRNTAVGS